MTSHGIDEKEKTRRASTADRPLIWKSVMTGVRAVARIRPEAIWPFSREFAVTTTHAIFDWGNKVTPLARKKRTKNKAARLQHDADRARIRTAFHGYDSEDVADPLESTKWRGHNPSRKQLALLQYFGIVEIPKNRGEASDWIDEKFKDPAMQQKTADWQFTRLIMHPEIYGQELSWFKSGLCNEMRAGVRYRVVGASGKLTSAKIASVVDALMRDDP